MRVLVPMDTSERSDRALEYAAELAARFDGSVDVVHYTEVASDDVSDLEAQVRETLSDAGVSGGKEAVEVLTDVGISGIKSADSIGKNVLELVEERGYDHVVMGHHEEGRVGKALLGSAAETVVRSAPVPVTVVP